MKDKGSYEKLLNVLNLDLDSPYWEREEVLENLADKLQILHNEGWLDTFLEMTDLYHALESSCWYSSERESWENSFGESEYSAGYDAAMEERTYDIEDRRDDWIKDLKEFLNSDWINLTRKAARELEDWFRHYLFEI